MKSDVTDAQLQIWLDQGDEAACAELYARFSPAVHRLTLGMLNDGPDAEEVLQDTFVYAFQNLRRYDPARSAFNTWLFTIAISRCRNKRRRKWLDVIPLEWLGPQPTLIEPREVETALEQRGVRRQLWAALQQLPQYQREAVVLRFLGGLRYKEIGQALTCNSKTAESRVRLGLAALRRLMTADLLELDGMEPGLI